MAPEVLGMTEDEVPDDGPVYDARGVDAWSIGVMLYLLVTGKYPFEVSSRS